MAKPGSVVAFMQKREAVAQKRIDALEREKDALCAWMVELAGAGFFRRRAMMRSLRKTVAATQAEAK